MNQSDEKTHLAQETRRRRARFRSWHRGMREADLILGGFADASIDALNGDELDQYEHLLELPDADLLRWFIGETPVPALHDTAVFRRIAARLQHGSS